MESGYLKNSDTAGYFSGIMPITIYGMKINARVEQIEVDLFPSEKSKELQPVVTSSGIGSYPHIQIYISGKNVFQDDATQLVYKDNRYHEYWERQELAYSASGIQKSLESFIPQVSDKPKRRDLNKILNDQKISDDTLKSSESTKLPQKPTKTVSKGSKPL